MRSMALWASATLLVISCAGVSQGAPPIPPTLGYPATNQGYPQGGFQGYPQGGFQGYPQGGFQGFPQGGFEESPEEVIGVPVISDEDFKRCSSLFMEAKGRKNPGEGVAMGFPVQIIMDCVNLLKEGKSNADIISRYKQK